MNALSRAGSLFVALPGPARGVIWMTISAASFALTYATVRQLSADLHTFQIVFLRSALGVAFMLPWLFRSGPGALKTERYGLYTVRIVLNYFGMVCLMYGIANLKLKDVTALMFTLPLFTVLFVAMLLGEKVGPHRWAAL